VAIRKKVRYRRHGEVHDTETDVTMPVTSYSNPGLAELIVGQIRGIRGSEMR